MKRKLPNTFVENALIPAKDRVLLRRDASRFCTDGDGPRLLTIDLPVSLEPRRLTMKGIVRIDEARLWAREHRIMVAKGGRGQSPT